MDQSRIEPREGREVAGPLYNDLLDRGRLP